ncbi:hypothetical protein [Methylobacterium pseudosasicola]|uniref:Uncharacterized protein n=1 Tax=Methylobacterium pseudosasicola TaxID=582667 RepID=A0A1I4QP28_9HYPH|nr:hypothetical protein [Methylobacterium pseudosasicola]SFM41465.1 hypothetical protein SAMN05192568_103078 [Methylobacterium pseudosasicola]
MFELLFSLISTPFGIGGIIAVAAAVAAFFLMPTLAMRVAPPLALVDLVLFGAGYVHRLTTDLAAARADAARFQEDYRQAEEVAVQNAEKARQLSWQQGVDAAPADRRLAEARAEAEKRLRAREAMARIEGAESVVCASGSTRTRAKPAAVPPAIDAALDALAPASGRHQ